MSSAWQGWALQKPRLCWLAGTVLLWLTKDRLHVGGQVAQAWPDFFSKGLAVPWLWPSLKRLTKCPQQTLPFWLLKLRRLTPQLCFVHNCSHYNELCSAGLGPPEARVRSIGSRTMMMIVTGLALVKDRLGGRVARGLARLLKSLAVPWLWPSSLLE